LKSPTSSFFLLSTDHRLLRGQSIGNLVIDVAKLRIAIGITPQSAGL
jgi:hypothetical protein